MSCTSFNDKRNCKTCSHFGYEYSKFLKARIARCDTRKCYYDKKEETESGDTKNGRVISK